MSMTAVGTIAAILKALDVSLKAHGLLELRRDTKFWNVIFTATERLSNFTETAPQLEKSYKDFMAYAEQRLEDDRWDPAQDQQLKLKLKKLKQLYDTQAANLSGYAHLENYLGDHLDLLEPELRKEVEKASYGKGTLAWHFMFYLQIGEFIGKNYRGGDLPYDVENLRSNLQSIADQADEYLALTDVPKLRDAIGRLREHVRSNIPNTRKLRVLSPEELGKTYGY